MDLGLDEAGFARLAADYRAACGVELAACLPDGRVVWGEPWERDEPVGGCAMRELAIREALRWGGPTFELSAADRLVWAVPLMRNALVLGGLVASVPTRGAFGREGEVALDLGRAATELRRLAEEANLTNAALLEARRAEEGRERHLAEAIHALKARPAFDLRAMYLLEEPSLIEAISRGDRREARAMLNQLLVGIHHAAQGRLHALKSYYLELVTTVSRTAVMAGGAPEELLEANLSGLTHLAELRDVEELTTWLRTMLEQAMDLVGSARGRDPAALMASAVGYMREHLGEDLSRDVVARVAHLSPAHFSRQFRRHLGTTFTELLTRLRVERACHLLLTSDRPVGLIALDCGFPDQSYFTKVFRKHRQQTPQAFRRDRRAADPPAGR